MANGHRTRTALAPATSKFIASLLDPLPDSELADPDLDKINRKIARKRLAEERRPWVEGMHMVSAARRTQRDISRRASCRAKRTETKWSAAEKGSFDAATVLMCREIDRQFRIPAPDQAALAWKRKMLNIGTLYANSYGVRAAALAADEVRLGAAARDDGASA